MFIFIYWSMSSWVWTSMPFRQRHCSFWCDGRMVNQANYKVTLLYVPLMLRQSIDRRQQHGNSSFEHWGYTFYEWLFIMRPWKWNKRLYIFKIRTVNVWHSITYISILIHNLYLLVSNNLTMSSITRTKNQYFLFKVLDHAKLEFC